MTGEFSGWTSYLPPWSARSWWPRCSPCGTRALYRLLTQDEPDHEAIAQWYSWWVEEVFPEEIRSLPSVAAEFERASS